MPNVTLGFKCNVQFQFVGSRHRFDLPAARQLAPGVLLQLPAERHDLVPKFAVQRLPPPPSPEITLVKSRTVSPVRTALRVITTGHHGLVVWLMPRVLSAAPTCSRKKAIASCPSETVSPNCPARLGGAFAHMFFAGRRMWLK